jgi:CDP-diacylglycerol--serine O-phosphatidyltransferase
LRRGVYVLPSLFTVGTLVCGYFAILSSLKGTQMLAAGMGVTLSLAAFGLDGRIARLTNSSSAFGREFDSLADVITFGVAPAFLAYAWGILALKEVYGTQLILHLRQVGWIATFAFVICGAARLARFNIDTTKGPSDRRHFVGLPIPASAGVIAALVHWLKLPVNDWIFGPVWLAVVGVLAFLMVSRVRYYSFKALDLRRRRPYITIIIIGMIGVAIWAFSEPVLLTIALTYALSGPIERLTSRLRPPPPEPKEVHAA